MITLSALARDSAVSSIEVLVICPSILCSVAVGAEIPPKRTFVRERFMATHCTYPLAPARGALETACLENSYHDVRQNRTANTDKRANSRKKRVVQHEPFSNKGKSRVGVQNSDDDS